MRQQVLQTQALWPARGTRDSPIASVVLLGGDIDAIAGLLVLRERQPLSIYVPGPLMGLLEANPVFDVLDPQLVHRISLAPLERVRCPGGLGLTLLPMPGKVPLYMEDRAAAQPEAGPTYAALLEAHGKTMIIAPACAEITEPVRAQLRQADVVFFDGTLFTDDEMIVAGLGEKTGRRMGHVPISGAGGTLERLADLPGRRIFLHINNSNPILMSGSSERSLAEDAGFEVAYDGMEVRL